MLLSIIVLTHNSSLIIEKCINSIVQACHNISFELIVVDNASSDNTINIIKENYPMVNLLINSENFGVAAARNIGIENSRGQFVLLLDDDITVHQNSIHILLSEISGDSSIGLLAPQLENPDGSIQYNGLKTPSVSNKLKRFAKKILHIPLQSEYIDAINSNKKYFPDYLIGAAQLFRKDIIKLTGLLDEKIFYGPEDADFCLRIKEQGYKIVCLPSVRMTHSYQRRSYKISQIPILLKHLKALFYFWNKHKNTSYR